MEQPKNNKFGYTYIVNDDSDLSPADDQLESMDSYLLDQQLVNLMQQLFDGANQSFYHANADIANNFFAGPVYPQVAVDALGYPGNNNGN